MKKLTKKYRIVHEGEKMVLPFTEEGMTGETFPSINAMAVEFDNYEDAKAYVEKHGLVYEDSSSIVE